MIKANIHAAKTNLSKLIEQALAGEEVVIAKAGKALVRLQPVEPAPAATHGSWIGTYRGKMEIIGDWADGDAEILADFEASEIFPPGVHEPGSPEPVDDT